MLDILKGLPNRGHRPDQEVDRQLKITLHPALETARIARVRVARAAPAPEPEVTRLAKKLDIERILPWDIRIAYVEWIV